MRCGSLQRRRSYEAPARGEMPHTGLDSTG